MENKIIVYAKLNENNEITELQSSIHLKDIIGWIKIDEGDGGDKYTHPQGNYFDVNNGDKPLRDELGRCNYKYIDGELIAITDEEKEILNPTQEPTPTAEELLRQQLLETQMQLVDLQEQILLLGGM